MRKSFVFLAGILLVGSGIFVACSVEQAEAKPKWEVEGHYAEACQCDVVCPCLYGKPASHGTCDNSQVFQFDKGRYEDMVLDGFYVTVTHGDQFGTPNPIVLRENFPEAEIILYGHTHVPLLELVDKTVTVMNPGSAGQPTDGRPASVGIMELEPGIPPRARIVSLE